MYQHETQIRVRYGETDQMGIVYYGNYCLYYEVARVEAIRDLGLTYKDLEEAGYQMPVVRVESKYIQGAQYDDLLTISSSVRELPDRFIVFDVEITREKTSIHLGKVTLCFRDSATGKRVRAPEMLLEKIRPYFH
ncbi:MAG: acyl-CoA thioesterase [Saprospiraceae bacterium]|nr:acyl-CoA thioesterase [Saprospiraceae bacterium]